ncbi:MAG: lysophospholipase [Planctomycetaceae bacterium]|nr:lysophospholipase [Planctomycetaceae bacterium]
MERGSVCRVESDFEAEPQVQLHYRIHQPVIPVEVPRNVLLIHGACEHGGRYQSFLDQAAQAGWTAIALDLRGHGQSTGNEVHIKRFENYVSDVCAFMEHLSLNPAHTLLVGCSMGGLIALRSCQLHWQRTQSSLCRGLGLVSPLLAIRHPIESWKIVGSKVLNVVRPRTKFRSTLDLNLLSHDEEVVASKRNDPLIRKHVTARWYWEIQHAMAAAHQEVDSVQLPVMLYQSGADYVVDPQASQAWASRVNHHHSATPHGRVQFHLLRGWYHEVLNEPQGDVVGSALLEFGEQRLGLKTVQRAVS